MILTGTIMLPVDGAHYFISLKSFDAFIMIIFMIASPKMNANNHKRYRQVDFFPATKPHVE
jgi:hypothetical protein